MKTTKLVTLYNKVSIRSFLRYHELTTNDTFTDLTNIGYCLFLNILIHLKHFKLYKLLAVVIL